MNTNKLEVNSKEISLVKMAELMSQYCKIYTKYYPSMRKLTNKEYKVFLEKADLSDKNARIKLLNSMIINIYEVMAKIYVKYDMVIPFEDNMSTMYEIAYIYIINKDELPKYISHLLAEVMWIATNKLKVKEINYKLHNIDVNYSDISRDVDNIAVNENNEYYDEVYQHELNQILKDQIHELCKRYRRSDIEKIILDYFGFLDRNSKKSYKTLSEECEISSERIRQIITKYLRILRHPYNSMYTKDFLYE